MNATPSSGAVTPRKPLPLKTLVLVLVLGGIAVVVVFLLWKGGAMGGHDAVRISKGFPTEQLYTFKNGKLHEVDVAVPGVLEDYEKGKGGKVGIVRMDDGAFEVFSLSGTPKQLTTDGIRKASLALSPDGTWIAYVGLTNLEPGEEQKISSWTVYILNIKSGEVTPLVSGYAPQFFMRDGETKLFFTSPIGLSLASPVEHATQTDVLPVRDDIHSVAVISDDGAYIAMKDAESEFYTLLEVEQISPDFFIHPIGVIETPLTSVAFVGDSLVGLGGTVDTPVLYEYDVAQSLEPESQHSLNASPSPYHLLP